MQSMESCWLLRGWCPKECHRLAYWECTMILARSDAALAGERRRASLQRRE